MPPQSADVLVLGAGLAGLRAALSCLEFAPSLSVVVASLTDGPSGSSFANINDALGMHVCLTDVDREAYRREVMALNRGAWLSSMLLAVQAEEGEARFRDLLGLGVEFTRDDSGTLLPHSSCFSPDSRRAYVFTGLTKVFNCFRRRLDTLGCRFLTGVQPAAVQGNPACGAVFVPEDGSAPFSVAAKAVIVALGGPGRLFAHTMTGPGVPGYGQGLLARAGARMANLGFLQFMWASVPGKRFWQPARLGDGGYSLLPPAWACPGQTAGTPGRRGQDSPGEDQPREQPAFSPDRTLHSGVPVEEIVPDLARMALQRASHCPFGYAQNDAVLDMALAGGLDQYGVAHLVQPDGSCLAVAPMAHASNGGAAIDMNAETSIPGLLACGECATGMHGANRLGGGMVLATQVFGHRAGMRAACIAANSGEPDLLETGDVAVDIIERNEGLAWLAQGLSRYAVLGGRPGRLQFTGETMRRASEARDWRLSLSLETAVGILEGLPYGY